MWLFLRGDALLLRISFSRAYIMRRVLILSLDFDHTVVIDRLTSTDPLQRDLSSSQVLELSN